MFFFHVTVLLSFDFTWLSMSINFCYTNGNIVALKSISRKCYLIEKNYSGKEVIIETYNTENRKT